jgi:creatinine amidohydrolase
MKKHAVRALLLLLVAAGSSAAQALSTKWEELTGPDFVQALQASKGTCALPFKQ